MTTLRDTAAKALTDAGLGDVPRQAIDIVTAVAADYLLSLVSGEPRSPVDQTLADAAELIRTAPPTEASEVGIRVRPVAANYDVACACGWTSPTVASREAAEKRAAGTKSSSTPPFRRWTVADLTALYGADPHFTAGMDSAAYLRHNRGGGDGVPCVMCEREALTARVRELRESYAAASYRTSELTARVATHEAYIRGANAEVARLRAQVDAVTALCDDAGDFRLHPGCAAEVRAALATGG